MAATHDLDEVVARDKALSRLGYSRHETGMPDRLFYRRYGEDRAYHLHVVPASTLSTRNELLLRDHLRAHPSDARRYACLKHELASQHHTSAEYTSAKTELIQELVDHARAAKDLPAVPVWEE
jgi:GrpB-like predicted nucleotidyltransferase (UPF0157 family)